MDYEEQSNDAETLGDKARKATEEVNDALNSNVTLDNPHKKERYGQEEYNTAKTDDPTLTEEAEKDQLIDTPDEEKVEYP